MESWIGGGGGGAPFHRASVVTFRAVNLMPRAAPGYVGTTGIGGAALAVRPLDSWLLTYQRTFGRDRFDLRPLPMPMRLEIAYAINAASMSGYAMTRPHHIRRLLRALPGGDAASLLDRSPESWMSYLGFSSERGYIERRFLLDAIGYLRDLIEGAGWDTEYPRDVWLLRRLGYPGRDTCLRFTELSRSGCGS